MTKAMTKLDWLKLVNFSVMQNKFINDEFTENEVRLLAKLSKPKKELSDDLEKYLKTNPQFIGKTVKECYLEYQLWALSHKEPIIKKITFGRIVCKKLQLKSDITTRSGCSTRVYKASWE